MTRPTDEQIAAAMGEARRIVEAFGGLNSSAFPRLVRAMAEALAARDAEIAELRDEIARVEKERDEADRLADIYRNLYTQGSES